MAARRRRCRRDGGFTLVELSVAAFLSSAVLAAVVLIFNSLGQGATDARRRADLQTGVREVVTTLSAELRSAEPARPGGNAIESLTGDSLVFYSDRYGFTGPERMIYERVGCSGGYCQLRVRRYAANPESGPNWTHLSTPFSDAVVLAQVAQDAPLFSGSRWSGDPARRVTVASCAAGTRCNFDIVTIDLRATAPGVKTIAGPFGLLVEVNLRNV